MRTTSIHMQAATELNHIAALLDTTKDPLDVEEYRTVLNSVDFLRSISKLELTPVEVINLQTFANVNNYALVFKINKKTNVYLALLQTDNQEFEFYFVALNAAQEYQIVNKVDLNTFL